VAFKTVLLLCKRFSYY